MRQWRFLPACYPLLLLVVVVVVFFTWVTMVQLRTAVRLSGQTEMISWERGKAGNGALSPFKGWSLNQEALPPQQNNRWGVRFLCYVSLRKIAKKTALSSKKPFLTTNRGVSVKAWRSCRRKCSNWYDIEGKNRGPHRVLFNSILLMVAV